MRKGNKVSALFMASLLGGLSPITPNLAVSGLAIGGLALCTSIALHETATAAPPTLVTTVEGVSEFRFDNGARLLLFPDASRPTISAT